jgi:hypothetical protein
MRPVMKNLQINRIAVLTIGLCICSTVVHSKSDDFNSVVKLIEQFYRVKHQGIPFLAKAGIKAVSTAARIKGGTAKRLAEAGSIKVAVFEDQSFDSESQFTKFRGFLNSALTDSWTPLIQTLSAPEAEQTYIFLRSAGENFHVLVITIERHDATVVQVTVSQKNLILLMRDPDGMGKAITDEATIIDQE